MAARVSSTVSPVLIKWGALGERGGERIVGNPKKEFSLNLVRSALRPAILPAYWCWQKQLHC